MNAIIPFDFEEQAVRVVMRDGEPWFVAADVCRVLEILNTSDAVKRLDEDEVTLDQIEGNHRPTNLVSESGLYALVIRSDKPAARRFRKWITAEVLPAIRRTGRYELPDAAAPAVPTDPALDARDWLAMIREARILGGLTAGRRIWAMSPLPPLADPAAAPGSAAEGAAALAHLAAVLDTTPDADLARRGLRLAPEGLIVAHATDAFAGTRWAGGGHRPALLSLPGVRATPHSHYFAGVQSRALVLPAALLDTAEARAMAPAGGGDA
ncbi:MAG TPA: Bro-N domain-containing protein [Paracoccaceae bacterium]|nr:Bro-N domain-containing protein [Paracoccaceae bacterium]HMO70088.1 Bro-N domain-containing protein [Paracoccaceae bacterium]